MNPLLINLTIGIVLSALMGLGGYYKRALSLSGALGAVVVGTAIFSFGGWAWGLVLITFFVSSSALSFFKAKNKQAVAEKFDKGHRRDVGQVLANGGVGALCAVASYFWPADWWWLAFLGAMATVTADTWATELGTLSRRPPRLITSGKIVSPGTSGGLTVAGTLAGLAGAAFIGMAGWGLSHLFGTIGNETVIQIVLISAVAGLCGAMLDSLLGATVQVMYRCPVCREITEQKAHQKCNNTPTEHLSGWAWLNNDWVNFISSVGGGIIAMGLGVF